MAQPQVRSRVSTEQLELLVSFMEEHPDFAIGKQSVYSRFSSAKLWRLLAERLNANAVESGGALKSPDKWCRYWADIKYKLRRKCAAGASTDLSHVEERLKTIFSANAALSFGGGGVGTGGASMEEGAGAGMGALRDGDTMSEEGSGGGGATGGGTEELLVEAALRQALAAEKQAEQVAQGVELLRELVSLIRERVPPCPAPAPPHHQLGGGGEHLMQHHRL